MPNSVASLPNLVGGVSQQPPSIRIENASEVMENAWPSIVSGLQKRPGTETVASVTLPSGEQKFKIHSVSSGTTGEEYFIIVGDNAIKAYKNDGTEITVSGSTAGSYLDFSGEALTNCKMFTVADTTYILNRNVEVSLDTPPTETRTDPRTQGTIFVERSEYATVYAVYLNDVKIGEFTSETNTTNPRDSTHEIAGQLGSSIQTYLNANPSETWTVGVNIAGGRWGSLVFLEGLAPTDTLTVLDAFGGTAMSVYKDTAKDFLDLPYAEREGRLIKVVGNADSEDDEYWVEWDGKQWVETVGYNEQEALDTATMPMKLVYNGTNLTLSTETWQGRIVGDSNSSPSPSFVGNKINDLGIHKGRFYFLSDENLVMSEADNYTLFYRSQIPTLTDDQVIDIAAVTGRVALLQHGVEFDETLLLFSDESQYRLNSGETLSPKTATLNYVSGFPCSIDCQPVNVGPYVYFADDASSSHPAIREYYIDNDGRTSNSEDISAQVPEYLPQNIEQLLFIGNVNLVLAHASSDPKNVYIYKYYWGGDRKVQSAWSKWTFSGDIISMADQTRYTYFLVKHGSSYYIERMDLSENPISSSSDYPVLFDRKLTVSNQTYNSSTNLTTFTLPYDLGEETQAIIAPGEPLSGLQLKVTRVNGTTYTVPGDRSGTSVVFGIKYNWLVQPSEVFIRQTKSSGESVIQDGRLQVLDMTVRYKDTSEFTIEVNHQNGKVVNSNKFEGRRLADSSNAVRRLAVDSGSFRVPVQGNSKSTTITIKSDGPYPVSLTSAEYQLRWMPKAGRRF